MTLRKRRCHFCMHRKQRPQQRANENACRSQRKGRIRLNYRASHSDEQQSEREDRL